jgi:hypothetical protein
MFVKKTGSDQFVTKHLLRRAGFGTTPPELLHYESMSYEKCVKVLLEPDHIDDSQLEDLITGEKFDFTRTDELRRWWILRMAFTRRPLQEKMTLFWHGHFATSIQKIESPYSMYMQNLVMRRMALGNFHDLLLAMTKDPAMIIWLDNQQNKKGQPNENYARDGAVFDGHRQLL